MPVYEVHRRTVLTVATVTAANETEARFLARDAWQQDAAIAALAADVVLITEGTATERAELRWGQ